MAQRFNIIKKNKDVIGNVMWNLVASFLSTGALQLVVHPLLAKIYDDVAYGNILFTVGIMNVIILAVGNALGDIRLTEDGGYKEEEIQGDFNRLLLLGCVISVVAMLAVFMIFRAQIPGNAVAVMLTLPIVCVVGTVHAYLTALFRLKLLFKQSLTVCILSTIGYLLGIAIAVWTGVWTIPFLLGHLFAILYQAKLTRFYKEPLFWTRRKKQTAKKYGTLSLSYLIKSSMTYVDRFVITPALGADMLSVYTIASTFGKLASIAIQPVANVALGYYAQKDFRMTTQKYWVTNIVTITCGALVYVFSLVLSKPFISILYPSYVESAMNYVALANIAAVMTAVAAMIQPAVLKYANVAWQVAIQLGYGGITVALSLVLIGASGLTGFCYAAIIANVCKIVVLLMVGDRGVRMYATTQHENA